MLESLVNFSEINNKPYLMAVWAFIVCTIAILISTQIPMSVPGTNSGFLVVMFTIIPSVYFITSLIKKEEVFEEKMAGRHASGHRFWERHEKDIAILLFFFVGMTLAFSVWSLFLPSSFFQSQVIKVNEIQGYVRGGQVTGGMTGSLTAEEAFMAIFYNNMQVLVFSFLFSFIFGAGAIFIIVWNASVLGVYIGQLSKHIWNIPIISLSFLPHGIPEIAGYLVAGLAGGILSASIIRKNDTQTLKLIAIDSLKLLVLASVFILIGAGIEAYLA